MNLGLERPMGAESVVQLKLFAQEAKKRGVIIDDGAVDLFIRNFTDGKITQTRFQEVVKEVAGKNLSKFDMYEYLKEEISKQLLIQMGHSGILYSSQALIAPSKNWTNFQKFNERAKIEAYPVFVDEYLEKVTSKPTEAELRKIYDAGKDRYPVPSIPEPGFRQRYRADVEYVMASFDAILKDEQAKITDEALQAEYDKRISEGRFKVPVEEFKPTDTKPDAGTPDAEKPASDKPSDSKPAEDKPAEEKPAEGKPAEEKPADVKTEDAKPSETKSEEPKPADASSSEAKPAEPSAEKSSEAAPPADTSRMPMRLKKLENAGIQLVAFVQEEKAGEAAESKEEPAKTEPAKEEPANPSQSRKSPKRTRFRRAEEDGARGGQGCSRRYGKENLRSCRKDA